jgi:hypothetical protein
MHTCFMRRFSMRHHPSVREIVIKACSSGTHLLSRSRRRRRLCVPPGKPHESKLLPYTWSGRRVCGTWICYLADVITRLISSVRTTRYLHPLKQSAKNPRTRILQVIHVPARIRSLSYAFLHPGLSSLRPRTRGTSTSCLTL